MVWEGGPRAPATRWRTSRCDQDALRLALSVGETSGRKNTNRPAELSRGELGRVATNHASIYVDGMTKFGRQNNPVARRNVWWWNVDSHTPQKIRAAGRKEVKARPRGARIGPPHSCSVGWTCRIAVSALDHRHEMSAR